MSTTPTDLSAIAATLEQDGIVFAAAEAVCHATLKLADGAYPSRVIHAAVRQVAATTSNPTAAHVAALLTAMAGVLRSTAEDFTGAGN